MKIKMEKLVKEDKDFLLTLETTHELTNWIFTNLGFLSCDADDYLEELFKKYGIHTELLINTWTGEMSLEQIFSDIKSYEKKLRKWNSEHK